ncbi:hypothetical protein [Streptomyces sp. GESEQ-35]|uniref:hypothetical protein n=1 Tax=Streptomyces sp. GESEQ-35 TaxID=2812657 RepID=UPI001B32CDF3|nr:hypothetical protein [Streptomyces sp. GESEQ-35]
MLTPAPPSGLWVPAAPKNSVTAPLTVRTWIGADPGGHSIAFALLAHLPARWRDATPADIRRRMMAFALAAGLRTPDQSLADLGTCLAVRDDSAHLRLLRIGQCLTLPTHEHWRRLLLTRPEVALVVGLAPLDVHAAEDEGDRYIDRCLHQGDLMVGRVHAECLAGGAAAGQGLTR